MEVVRRDPEKKPARSGQGERNVSLDVLRIAAVMGIIAVHAIDGLETIHPLRDWVTRNVYYSMVRWSVPAFIMFAFFQSAAVFLFFTSRDWTCLKKHEDRLKKVSKLTFGIYLVHIMVMELIGRSTTLPFPIIVIPAYCLVVFALSFAAVTLLDRIPVVRKYAL